MSKPLASFGVNQIIKTEKNAAQKIEEARKRRVQRLKQAQTEAQEEVNKLRAEREEQFMTFKQNANSYGKDAELRVENAAHRAIEDMVVSAEENRPKVIEQILKLVCDIKPELHKNYFLWKNKNKKNPPGSGSPSAGSRSRYSSDTPPAEHPSKSDNESMDRSTNRSGKSSENSSKSKPDSRLSGSSSKNTKPDSSSSGSSSVNTKPDSSPSETRSSSPSPKFAMNANRTMCTVCDPNTRTKDGTICNLCDPHRTLLGGSNTNTKGKSSTSTGEAKSGTSKKGNAIYHTMYKYTSDDVVEWICPGEECGGEDHEEVLPSNATPNVYTVETSYPNPPFKIAMECGTPKLESCAPKNILFPIEEIKQYNDCNPHGQQFDENEEFVNDDDNAVYTKKPPYLDTSIKIVVPKKLEDCASKNILLNAGQVEDYIDFNKHNRQKVPSDDSSKVNSNVCAVATPFIPCLNTTVNVVMECDTPKLESCAPKNILIPTEENKHQKDCNPHGQQFDEIEEFINDDENDVYTVEPPYLDKPFKIVMPKKLEDCAPKNILLHAGEFEDYIDFNKHNRQNVPIDEQSNVNSNDCAVETPSIPLLDTKLKIVMPPKQEECVPKNISFHTGEIEPYVDLNSHDPNNVEVDDYISTTKSTTPATCGDVMGSIIIKTTASIADRMIAFPGGREDQTIKEKKNKTSKNNMPEGVIISSTDANVIIKISSKPNNQYTLALSPPSVKCENRHASSEQPIVISEEPQDITNSQQQSKNTTKTTIATSKVSPTLSTVCNQDTKDQDETSEF